MALAQREAAKVVGGDVVDVSTAAAHATLNATMAAAAATKEYADNTSVGDCALSE